MAPPEFFQALIARGVIVRPRPDPNPSIKTKENTNRLIQLTYVLDVGRNFMNRADQAQLLELIRDTHFYAGVAHSFAKKPVMVRVKRNEQSTNVSHYCSM
jgi:hypothetical protein